MSDDGNQNLYTKRRSGRSATSLTTGAATAVSSLVFNKQIPNHTDSGTRKCAQDCFYLVFIFFFNFLFVPLQ